MLNTVLIISIINFITTILGLLSLTIVNNKLSNSVKSDKELFSKQIKKIQDNEEKEIQNISEKISTNSNSIDELLKDKKLFEKQIELLTSKLDEVNIRNLELKKKIEFFTEIGEDSKKLNETDNTQESEKLLSKATKEVSELNNLELENNNTVLDKIQLNICKILETTNKNCFITGRAGVGKSFLLNAFIHGTSKNFLVLAPTGVAAINIGGETIHSAFGFWNLEKDINDINEKTLYLNDKKQLVLKNVDIIIIDEISMVRCDIFDKIDKILRIVNKTDAIFGGKQLIISGDLFQLPPIAQKDELKYLNRKYGGIYFFNSNAFKNGGFEFFELTENHRQKSDQDFFNILNSIREGIIDENNLKVLNSRYITDTENLRRVPRLFPKKDQALSLNNTELSKIQAKEYVFEAEIIYNNNNLKTSTIENFPINEKLCLKLGALIMMVKNGKDKCWVNGSLGIVSYLDKNIIKVKINGIEYIVEKERFDMKEARYENGKINYETIFSVEQYPVVLSYAITIHKSQGMTYKQVACDISECFEGGQAYVALSRSSSLNGLYLLNKVNEMSIQANQEVIEFYKKINRSTLIIN